jgi:hypothetical protein
MTRIVVRVRPNASMDELIGVRDGVFDIRLKAAPIEGRANDALVKFLAKKLRVTPSELSIIRGASSKRKMVEIPLPETEVLRRLEH